MKKRLAAAAILAMTGITAGLTPGRASADAITGSFTGIFGGGSVDSVGYFGVANANLSGDAFTVTVSYASPGSGTTRSGGSGAEFLSGSPVTDTVTVGATTLSFTSGFTGSVNLYQAGQLSFYAAGQSVTPNLTQMNLFLGTSTTYAFGILDSEAGFNSVLDGLTAPSAGSFGLQLANSDGSRIEFLSFSSITGTSAAPEPSSLALFGVAVLSLYYLRRRIA